MSRRAFLGAGVAALTAMNISSVLGAEEPVSAAAEVSETIQQKRERIGLELERVWNEQISEITRRNTTLSTRYDGIVAALKQKNMDSSIPTLAGEWRTIVTRFKTVGNAAQAQLDVYHLMQNDMEKTLERWEHWDKLSMPPAAGDPEFHPRYKAIVAKRKKMADAHAIAILTDKDGKFLQNYAAEKKKDPKLTHAAYIKRLASVLECPENLAMYLRYFVRYAYDSPTSDWKAEGTEKSYGDYWQSAAETLERTDNGWLLGDCEDQAALAQAILKDMGIHATLVFMPSHITCSWIEKNAAGRYDGYDIGNFGLEKNGVGYGVTDGVTLGTRYLPTNKAEFTQGFATPQEAHASVMRKFVRSPALGVPTEWMDRAGFNVAHIVDGMNAKGVHERTNSTSYLSRSRLLEFVRPSTKHLATAR